MDRLELARKHHTEQKIRWGFAWALWCGVLWGAWYVPGSALYYETPIAELSATTTGFLKAAAVITTLNAIAVLLAMGLWVAVLGKTKDYVRTIRQVRITKWYALAALFGGPMAIYGAFLAIGYVGGQFGAASALLYPVVGAAVARLWLKEKITPRAVVGLLVIIAGGIFIFTPGLAAEVTAGQSNAWIGYIGAVMTIVGFGIEGVIAGRVLDVTDPDVGLTVRFTVECAYWLLIILPVSTLFLGSELWVIAANALSNPIIYVWLLLAGLTFGFCYVAWYKSFPLIGVGRGQAITAVNAPAAFLWLWLFTFTTPSWHLVVGGFIALVGIFVLFTDRRGVLEVIRALPGVAQPAGDDQLVGGTLDPEPRPDRGER